MLAYLFTERRVGYRMAAGGKPPVEEEPLVDSPNGAG